MPRIILTLLLVSSFLLAQTNLLWARNEKPVVFCGQLDEEDCALLEASAEAMRDLTAQRVTSTTTVEISKIPQMVIEGEEINLDEMSFEILSESLYTLDENASKGLRVLAEIEPNLLSLMMIAAPETFWEIIKGVQGEWHYEVSLSESLQVFLSQQANDEVPEFASFTLRLVDNMLFIDADEIAVWAGEPRQKGMKQWVAFDLEEFAEQLTSETSEGQAFAVLGVTSIFAALSRTSDIVKLYEDLQLLGELNPDLAPGDLVEVERKRNQSSGEALFETTADVGGLGLWMTNLIQRIVEQAAPSDAGPLVAGLMFVPGIASGFDWQQRQLIEIENGFVLEQESEIVWKMAPLATAIRTATATDQFSPIRILERNPKGPIVTITSKTNHSDFNEDLEIDAPEAYDQPPLDELFQ